MNFNLDLENLLFGFGGNIGQQSQVIQDQQQNWRETSSKKVMFGSMIDES